MLAQKKSVPPEEPGATGSKKSAPLAVAPKPGAKGAAAPAGPGSTGTAPETGKKGKRGKPVLIILSLVVAAGAAGAGWFYLKHKRAGADSVPVAEKKKPPIFLPIEQFTVNLAGNGGDHFLQIAFTLQVADTSVIEELKLQLPAVRSRLLLLLASKTAEDLSTTAGKQKLIGELLAEARAPLSTAELPGKGVTNLHFSAFVIQ